MSKFVISDPEGTDISHFVSKLKEGSEDKLYICGDVLDSTTFTNDPDILLKRMFNLRNLQTISDNNQITLISGNRDLNKIKLLLLGKLNGDSELYTQFNTGQLDPTHDNYKLLCDELKRSTVWNESMLQDTYDIFWMNKKSSNLSGVQPVDKLFFNRFTEIFQESLGATNLLYTIPQELGIHVEDKDALSYFATGTHNDFFAFVVILIFNRLLHPRDRKVKQQLYTGLLCTIFKKMKYADVIIEEPNTYLLSHGGITRELYKNPEILEKYYGHMLTDKGLGIMAPVIREHTFENVVKYWNDFLRDIINSILDHTGPPTQHIKDSVKFLLFLCAAVNCSNQGTTKLCGPNDFEAQNELSPMIAGLANMMEHYALNDTQGTILFHVFGHKPFGFSPTVKFMEEPNPVVLINLDTTNSFSNTSANSLDTQQSCLCITSTETYIDSTVIFNRTLVTKHYTDTLKFKEVNANEKFPTLYYSKGLTLGWHTLNFTRPNLTKLGETIYKRLKEIDTKGITVNAKKQPHVFFHGIITYNGEDYNAFTVTNGLDETMPPYPALAFQKDFYILNDSDFRTYFSLGGGQGGGGISSKQKYLKYKMKYTNLKRKLRNNNIL